MISRWLNSRVFLWCIGTLSLAYAVTVTTLNLAHIRAMPDVTRVLLPSLENLTAASLPVRIVERSPEGRADNEPLERSDVHIEYGQTSFPPSRSVWINTSLPPSDRGRYLHRFRAGYLRSDADGTDIESLFLIEVHQSFGQEGDAPRANLWLFPPQQRVDGAAITDAVTEARFAHNILLSEARKDAMWRAVFADAHARIVRAFPALAAALIGIAAFGSLLFGLWRQQPWAVVATTVTFVLPIVSAAPFLTAFGWTPITAARLAGVLSDRRDGQRYRPARLATGAVRDRIRYCASPDRGVSDTHNRAAGRHCADGVICQRVGDSAAGPRKRNTGRDLPSVSDRAGQRAVAGRHRHLSHARPFSVDSELAKSRGIEPRSRRRLKPVDGLRYTRRPGQRIEDRMCQS